MKSNFLISLPFLFLASGTIAQESTLVAPEGTGSVRMSVNKQCLEPGHESYETESIISFHKTMKECIFNGGSRDGVRFDEKRTSVPEFNNMPEINISPDMMKEIISEAIDDINEERQNSISETPEDDSYVLNADPGQSKEDKEKIRRAIVELNIRGPLGAALTLDEITPEKIIELQEKGTLPENLQTLLEQGTAPIRISTRKGPAEIELPKVHTYSETKKGSSSLFRSPEAYVGRSAKDFMP